MMRKILYILALFCLLHQGMTAESRRVDDATERIFSFMKTTVPCKVISAAMRLTRCNRWWSMDLPIQVI